MAQAEDTIEVASLEELEEKSPVVVSSGSVPIVVFCDHGTVHAVDNRCPHMGFPLHRGTVQDGILTCHWHHARFDLSSGCTFDLFADDVTAYPTEVRDGRVYVHTSGNGRDPVERGRQRLREGMEQNIRLVIAKAVVKLLYAGVEVGQIAALGGLYGVTRRQNGWGPGLTILTAMANLSDHLEGDERIAPLYQGLVHVARDCAGQPPKLALRPLEGGAVPLEQLGRWFRDLVEVRNVDGAERCLRTAIAQGASDAEVAAMMGAAATDHFYLDGGHTVDFINKAFELLDRIGWERAGDVLASLVRQLCQSQRSEEQNAWRHPIDLVSLLRRSFEELPALLRAGEGGRWECDRAFVHTLLGDDPHLVIEALEEALRRGASAAQLAQALSCAAARRVARFHVQNEFSDWIAVLHTYSYANALQQLMARSSAPELLRGVFHGAARVYLDRFLNVPPARLPAAGSTPRGPIAGTLLEMLNQQQQVDQAGKLVYGHLAQGGGVAELIRALSEALLREDAEFHNFQMLEAAVRQYGSLDDEEERRIAMVAAARYLAAHAPTQREMLQTLRIALRLHRGEPVYEEE